MEPSCLAINNYKRQPFQKRLKLQEVTQSTLCKNVLWISKYDFDCLFKDVTSNKAHHILIASRVYRVMIGSMQRGWLSASSMQMVSLSEAAFNIGCARAVVAIPFHPTPHSTYPVLCVWLRLSDDTHLYPTNQQVIITAKKVKQTFSNCAKQQFLSNETKLLLSFDFVQVLAEVTTLFPNNYYREKQLIYGCITERTEYIILKNTSLNTKIVHHIHRDDILSFSFKLTLSKRIDRANKEFFPLVIPFEEMQNIICNQLREKVICKDYLLQYPHRSGWNIQIRLKQVDMKNTGPMHQKNEDTIEGYLFTEKAELFFDTPSDILITKGDVLLADDMTFLVSELSNIYKKEKGSWVVLKEVEEFLKIKSDPLTVGEIFPLHLSTGCYLVKVASVHSEKLREQPQLRFFHMKWKIGENTNIKILPGENSTLSLINSTQAHPVVKAWFQLEVTFGEPLLICKGELEALILNQGPKKLIKNQNFFIHTTSNQKLAVKLTDLEFNETVHCSNKISFFGRLTDKSQQVFFIKPKNRISIHIVDRVYSKEIETFTFSLIANKRSMREKVPSSPLLIEKSKIVEKIRQELGDHAYIIDDFKTKIPCKNGWSVEAVFKGVSLKKEDRFENIFLENTMTKKGFTLMAEAPIDFVNLKNIVFIEGEPFVASFITFNVLKILERYNPNNSPHVKGDWIDSDEIKTALIKNSRALVHGQRFVLDLGSGKFLLEMKAGKGDGSQKANTNQWIVRKKTKIRLFIEKGLEIQEIKTEEAYSLKKIIFEIYPEKALSEKTSLKEIEIQQALNALLPLKILKTQNLTVDTENNLSLQLLVKDMCFTDEIKSDPKNHFGLITEKTEVVFKDKKNTNLAVQSSPKILEMTPEHLERLGIGGIDKQFKQIRRIFYSRCDRLAEETKKRGIKPVKGILLHGPPGTGKTTLAKHIGKLLGCSGERLKMLTSTEVFNMWFGGSEENIRKIFSPARQAQKKFGKKSPLYMIVIDEIDALLPTREGSLNKIREPLVNTFLGELDGLKELNNLLVIATTNRKDVIAPAALRSGRLGVHIEIQLPDKKGREQIFAIHTKNLAQNQLLAKDVVLSVLAEKTEHFSGADIEGLVQNASSFSQERLYKLTCSEDELKTHEDGIVTMHDFERALEEKKQTSSRVPDAVKFLYQ